MTSDARALIAKRNEEVAAAAARERERRPNDALAAIELCAENVDERADDRRAVRCALEEGASPAELGPLFVTVVADLTYEIDWGDQFRFWPLLAESLAVESFDVAGDVHRRRATAHAFDAFADRYGGIYPVGSFSAQFPLMSRALVHSMLPRCSQRHVARLLARASIDGEIPNDAQSPWPVEHLVEVGEALSLPLFVRGLLENRAVLEPAGRALLGFTSGDPAPWVRRIADTVRADAVTQDLVERARRSVRRARTVERQRALASPRISLALTEPIADGGVAGLWIELSRLADAEASVEGLGAFARSGALLRTVANKKAIDERPLSRALVASVVLAYPGGERTLAMSVAARAFTGAVPEPIGEFLAGAGRDVKFPMVLRASGAARYTEVAATESVETGSLVVVLVERGAPIESDLSQLRFERVETGASVVNALRGIATDAASAVLSRCGVSVRPPVIALEPILFPPSRSRGDELVYPAGAEAWARVRGVRAPGLRIEASPPTSDVGFFVTDDGEYVLRIRGDGVVETRFYYGPATRPAARATIRFEPTGDVIGATRWRATLQPTEATTTHLVERLCWLRVEALPGVTLRFELAADFGGVQREFSLVAGPEDVSTPLASMRFFDRLLDGAEVRADEPPPTAVTLKAWSEDEPDRARIVARVGASASALRFASSDDGLSITCSAGSAALSRLEIASHGISLKPLASASVHDSGLYVASFEGTYVAACLAERSARLPRLPSFKPPARSLDGLRDSVALLRALEVAAIWPQDAFAHGLLLRRAAVRVVERALVGTLCGEEWLRREEELAAPGLERAEALTQLKYLTWISDGAFGEAVAEAEDDDPFAVATAALKEASLTNAEREAARHLLLLFYRRGLASPSGDERALRLAWANRQVARAVRLAYLAIPDAFDRWHEPDDQAADDD